MSVYFGDLSFIQTLSNLSQSFSSRAGVALVVLAITVFLTCLFLYERNTQERKYGWLKMLSTVFIVSVAASELFILRMQETVTITDVAYDPILSVPEHLAYLAFNSVVLTVLLSIVWVIISLIWHYIT